MNPATTIGKVTFDAMSVRQDDPALARELNAAVVDLLEENYFKPLGVFPGPYHLVLGTADGRLVFDIRDGSGATLTIIGLSPTPFRRVARDYRLICDSYQAAVREHGVAHIETLDMGRRGVHNEAAEILRQRFEHKIDLDLDTARRLFTLIYLLLVPESAK
jgi:uncharacterized protein (UPF0262 family)